MIDSVDGSVDWKESFFAALRESDASQAREAALREKLEAAEARIKASQEQEPEFVDFEVYGYASDNARNESWCKEKDWSRTEFLNIIGEDWAQKNTIRNVVFHHYSAPIIPPELAELQRELDRWKNSALTPREESMQRENAELTRKLAEQQALNGALVHVAHDAINEMQEECECDSSTDHTCKQCALGAKLFKLENHHPAELRKLLESKVPEVIESLALWFEKNYSQGAIPAKYIRREGARLAAAPQPKEPKQSPETDLDEALRRQ